VDSHGAVVDDDDPEPGVGSVVILGLLLPSKKRSAGPGLSVIVDLAFSSPCVMMMAAGVVGLSALPSIWVLDTVIIVEEEEEAGRNWPSEISLSA
jgi:hypothetical protein